LLPLEITQRGTVISGQGCLEMDGFILIMIKKDSSRNFSHIWSNPIKSDNLNLRTSRGIDKSIIARLATGEYLAKGESVLITGSTGCGKSFIASALGHHACAQGHKVAYFNIQKLMMKTKMARAEGTIFKLFESLSKTQLLILDDFGLTHLGQQQQLDLMEIMEDRHSKSSTIIASQLPVSSWFDVIGQETIADAILDRLVHTSHRLELKGDSLRKTL
jgi:DNA replication protein DnaC